MTLFDDVIARIQTIALAVEGIEAAPDEPTEATMKYPIAITYPGSGTLHLEGAAQARDLHNIICDVMLGGTMLNKTVASAKTILIAFKNGLQDDPYLTTKGVINFGEGAGISYEFGRIEWANQGHIGFRFTIPVKIRQAVST